jgi:hypothetical protein
VTPIYPRTAQAFGEVDDPETIAREVETAVAMATLIGAPHAEQAALAVRVTLDCDARRAHAIVSWLHDLYPQPEGSEGAVWLPPLQPDRLGEELVARVIRRQIDRGVPRANLLPHRLRSDGQLTSTQEARLLTVLIRAANHDTDMAEILSEVISSIPTEVEVDVTDLEGALPEYTIIQLQPILRRDHQYPESRPTRAHPGGFLQARAHAGLLTRSGKQQWDLGRLKEALAAMEKAVEIYRELAAARPAAINPELALALNSLSDMLWKLGRQREASAATKEAAEIFRSSEEA